MKRWFSRVVGLLSRAIGAIRRRWRLLVLVNVSLLFVIMGLLWATGEWVRSAGEPWIYQTFETVPVKTVAIVPGASVRPGGVPSVMLQDRLEVARGLYNRDKVGRILVSGDNQTRHYNETKAMKQWLIKHGVPAEHIYADFAGFRTLDTMERAAQVFKVRDAVICTQAFHLYRSIFLARRAEIDAVGLIADRRPYKRERRARAREYFARTLAFVDAYLLGTEPHFLGPPIPVDGPPQR